MSLKRKANQPVVVKWLFIKLNTTETTPAVNKGLQVFQGPHLKEGPIIRQQYLPPARNISNP